MKTYPASGIPGFSTSTPQRCRSSAVILAMVFAAVIGVILPASGASSAASRSPAGKAAKSSYTIARAPYLGAIVVDAATGKALFEDNADKKAYPASVLKLMDLLLILEKVERGELSVNAPIRASANAARTPKSKVYLAVNETFPLDEMLYALMVHSANDVAVALAENIAGSTGAFVELMNARARALGMNNTLFQTVNGLPPGKGKPHDVTTARDIAVLCREVLKHPEALRYTSTRERTFRPKSTNKIEMGTHNHLLGKVQGCDGLKTGYTAAAGFSIAVTAARNGQRVVVVVLGSTDIKTRDARAAELVEKGFRVLQPGSAGPLPGPSKATRKKRTR